MFRVTEFSGVTPELLFRQDNSGPAITATRTELEELYARITMLDKEERFDLFGRVYKLRQ